MPFIEVKDLCKEYQILQRQNGFGGYIQSLFHPVYVCKKAVKNSRKRSAYENYRCEN